MSVRPSAWLTSFRNRASLGVSGLNKDLESMNFLTRKTQPAIERTFPSRKYFHKGARIVHFLAFCRFALNKALICSTLKPNAFPNVGKNADQDFLNFPILWEIFFLILLRKEKHSFEGCSKFFF